jgi:hypothetical protein
MAKKPKNENTEINDAANDLTKALTEQAEEQPPAEQADANDASIPASDEAENINAPGSATEEPSEAEPIQPPAIPKRIKILKNFRIEMPLAGRKDISLTLSLKKDQEISDPKVIKHVLKSDAQFIVL